MQDTPRQYSTPQHNRATLCEKKKKYMCLYIITLFGRKSVTFGKHEKERRAACANCTDFPRMSDAMCVNMQDIDNVEAPVAAQLTQAAREMPVWL